MKCPFCQVDLTESRYMSHLHDDHNFYVNNHAEHFICKVCGKDVQMDYRRHADHFHIASLAITGELRTDKIRWLK